MYSDRPFYSNACYLIYRSHILQADSEEAYLAWVTAMQQAIGAAIQRGMGTGTIVNIRESQSQNVKGLNRQQTKPKSRYLSKKCHEQLI